MTRRTTGKHPHQLCQLDAVKQFLIGGNATLTLVSKDTGTRFTFNVRQSTVHRQVPGTMPPHWDYFPVKGGFEVKVLAGSDRYQWIGRIKALDDKPGLFSVGNDHRDAPSTKAFQWFWRRLCSGTDEWMALVEVWHEGMCGMCGRALTVPESIKNGIGPECAQRLMAQGLLDSIL